MGKKIENRNSKKAWFLKFGLFFLAMVFVFLGNTEDTKAATVACTSSTAQYRCTWTSTGSAAKGIICLDNTNKAECDTWCQSQPGWAPATDYCVARPYTPSTGSTGTATVTKTTCKTDDYGGWAGNMFMSAFKGILYALFQLIAWFLGAAVSLFAWVIDPNNVSFIMGNTGLYASWAMVRDFLNLGFILVLLYIAFCVIFQIGSYSDSWKKMLIMMVIMALLVNFSFSICRFIIDVSNIVFYYILNAGFGDGIDGSGIMTSITNQAGLQTILDVNCVSVSYLLAMIVFTFILMLTFLVIAILFIVRMVAIGMLIIFSPVGIAGAAFPFSKKYAGQWWDNLFKYSFFAPIMIFMILIAFNILALSSRDSFNIAAQKNIGADTGIDGSFLGTMAFFSIPVVILWVGMGVAQSMSIFGAKTVTGHAQKFATWAGKKVSGYGWAEKRVKAFGAERKKREDEKFKNNIGARLGKGANSFQDRAHGAFSRKGDPIYQKDADGNETDVVIGHTKARKGLFGAKSASDRHRSTLIASNKEDIKKQHEDMEGETTNNLFRETNNFNLTSTTSHDAKIKAAAQARQAMSRGKEYDTELTASGLRTDEQKQAHYAKLRGIIKAAEMSKT